MAMCLSATNLATRPYILCMRALHNLINNSNNDDRQQEKIITIDEKILPLFSKKIKTETLACHPPKDAGSLIIKGCFSRA